MNFPDIKESNYIKTISQYFNLISSNRFVKDLSITFFENIITKGLNFLIILMLTRTLGPEDYGKYSFIFVNMAFLAAFLDFGMENTTVRFAAKEKSLNNAIFGLYFITKFSILSVVILALVLFGKEIFIHMNKAALVPYIPYFIIGLLGESLFFVNDTFLQAVQKFKARAIINITRNCIALSIVFALYLKHLLILKYAFFTYFIAIIFSMFFVKNYFFFLKDFFRTKLNSQLIKDIFHYEKWMLFTSIAQNLIGRIDFLMLSFFVGYKELGIYNAAFQLCSIVSFLPFVLGKVMLPKMSELQPEKIFIFTKNVSKSLLVISLIMFCLVPLSAIVVPLILGKVYEKSVFILQILLVGFIISFYILPFSQAIYALGKPKYYSFINYVQFIITIVLNTIFIPRFGIIAAAIIALIAKVIALVMLLLIYKKQEDFYRERKYV